MLAALAGLGVRASSLLVIPNHHRGRPILEDAHFLEWLRAQARSGHEIVTHGYRHQRPRRSNETWLERMTTRVYTVDEGEFYDLDRATASALVAKGNTELRQIGLEPRGFIAPAWLLSTAAEEALRELGVDYTARLGSVLDLQTGRSLASQSLVWSVRSRWRRQISRAWNAFLFGRLAASPLMRISLHPGDLNHRAVWRQVCALVTRALEDREPLTYHAWLTRERGRPAFPDAAARAGIGRSPGGN